MSLFESYIEKHKKRYIDELIDFLKIPSISAQFKFKKNLRDAANFLKQKLIQAGVDKAVLYETKINPLVYAEKILDKNKPTILIYGHYDVQPPEPYELWEHPPFEPFIKNNNIYARGSSDDKGQIFIHIKALEVLNFTKKLNVNLKFIIEGEEEMGSDSISEFLDDKTNLDLLKSDGLIISDTAMIDKSSPSIPISLRGILTADLKVIGPNKDLHSGIYGGAIANPIEILSNILSSLKDSKNKIALNNFYDDVIELANEDKNYLSKVKFDLDAFKKELSIKDVKGELGYSTKERIGIRPSLDVNGIWGGYTNKEGFKTVIPSEAYAKLSIRLVPNQDIFKISKSLKLHIENNTPSYAKSILNIHEGASEGIVIEKDTPLVKKAKKYLKKYWNKEPILTREGGSIPIVSKFYKKLNVPIAMIGFGLPTDNIHSPNENFKLSNFFKGLYTLVDLYSNY